MFFPVDHPATVDVLVEQYHALAETINKAITWPGKRLNLLPGADVCYSLSAGQLARIERGLIHVNWGYRTAFVLQAGDFIFHFDSLNQQTLSYMVEEPSTIMCIHSSELNDQLSQTNTAQQQWHSLLMMQSAIFSNAYGANVRQGIRPSAGFQRYSAGETIIKEGTPAEHVFTLLKGEAIATVRSTPLGHINEGEIFGALAAITGEARNATVVAQSSCTVMAVPKEQFIDLIKAQPDTCLKMIKTMAYQITDLNDLASSRVDSTL